MEDKPEHSSPRAALYIGLFFAVFGAVFCVIGWGTYFRDRWIIDHGTTAPGVVTKKSRTFDAEGDSDFYLHYRFMIDDRPVEGMQSVDRRTWVTRRAGDPLIIRYHPEKPRRHFVDGYGNDSLGMTLFVSGMGLIFFLFGGALVVAAIRQNTIGEE